MKFELTFLSKFRSLLGIDFTMGANMVAGEDETPHLQPTIEVTIGLLLFYIKLTFEIGSSFSISDLIEKLKK